MKNHHDLHVEAWIGDRETTGQITCCGDHRPTGTHVMLRTTRPPYAIPNCGRDALTNNLDTLAAAL
jgi:hypothetical protein